METLWTILVWAVSGLVIGAIAKALMPGADSTNVTTTSLLGIVGAIVGGVVASALGVGSFRAFTLGGLVIAVLGAMAVLALYRFTRRAV